MKKLYFIIIPILLFSFSCSKDNVKPSADFLLSNDALKSINKIKDAYEGKDRYSLQGNLDSRLTESVIKNLFFEEASLTFTPRLIKISESTVTVNLNWRGVWKTVNNKELKNRGVADLVLSKETMNLIQIDGDNPFLTPIVR